jgi:hypothetical protein
MDQFELKIRFSILKIFQEILFLTFIIGLSGCYTAHFTDGPTSRDGDATEEKRLYHVVLCWLKEPGNKTDRKKIIEVTKLFNDIPEVINARAGEVVMSDRDIVDDSYDVGILIVTKNENQLQKYLDHPIHQKAKKDVLVPLVNKILVYDFKN